ncbi:MAG: bacteriocin-processing peptidase [Parcubacteria group bacterium Athens1014_10]|nr:MAG: bacteriocin-processing peptidase [Parcubacteria group bacterium Athens1014_10]TSD05887.1 MAG: bacteriocin-processing peptidase [Parcubacteria group bacterium Athens0714_12]
MKIIKFPELRQTYNYDCGANAMQSILAFYGIDINEKTIMDIAGTKKSGTPIKGLEKVAKKYNLKFRAESMTIDKLKKYIDKNIPVILLIQAWIDKKNNQKIDWGENWSDGHYVIAIGYDHKKIYFEDPWSISRTYLSFKELNVRWHDVDSNGKKFIDLGIIIYGKKGNYDLNHKIHMD